MLNKYNLAIAALCSKEEARFTHRGIWVTPKETVETDGHQLMRVTMPEADPDSFPEVPGAGKATRVFEPFLLDAGDAIALQRALPKKTTIPILEYAAVSTLKDGSTVVVTTDLQQTQTARIPQNQDKKFVDWERVTPALDKAGFQIRLDAALLGPVLKQIELFARDKDKGGGAYVDFSFGDPQSGLRIDAHNSDTGQDMIAVVMPVRAEDLPNVIYNRRADAEKLIERLLALAAETVRNDKDKVMLADELIKEGKALLGVDKKDKKKDEKPESKPAAAAAAAETKPAKVETPAPKTAQPAVQLPAGEVRCSFCQLAGHTDATCALKRILGSKEGEPVGGITQGNSLTPVAAEPGERARYGGEVRNPLPSYTERMRKATNADAGREIIAEHEAAVHDLEVELGLKPTVGALGGGFGFRGFSTLSPRERQQMVKRAFVMSKEGGAKLKALVEDGVALEVPWKELYSREMGPRFPGKGAKGKGKAAVEPAAATSLPSSGGSLPAAKAKQAVAAAVVSAAALLPHLDKDYRKAVVVSLDGLGRNFKRFWKIGQTVQAKRELCDPCHGDGAINDEPCPYCGGTRLQVEIKEGPDGIPVVVDPANVRF